MIITQPIPREPVSLVSSPALLITRNSTYVALVSGGRWLVEQALSQGVSRVGVAWGGVMQQLSILRLMESL